MGSVRVTETELGEWGRGFAQRLHPPVTIGLSGELGSGKTALVRAIAAGLGVREPVTSPAFALVHVYRGAQGAVYHVDAYRLRPTDDVRDLDLEVRAREPGAVVCIEWPERLGSSAPWLTYRLRLEHDGPQTRRIRWG